MTPAEKATLFAEMADDAKSIPHPDFYRRICAALEELDRSIDANTAGIAELKGKLDALQADVTAIKAKTDTRGGGGQPQQGGGTTSTIKQLRDVAENDRRLLARKVERLGAGTPEAKPFEAVIKAIDDELGHLSALEAAVAGGLSGDELQKRLKTAEVERDKNRKARLKVLPTTTPLGSARP